MRIVGLTGGIACGKSSVSAMLHDLGAYIVDVDKIAYTLVQPGRPAWQSIVDHFGRQILNKDNTIDRAKLGEIVFSNREEQKVLENIIHPLAKEKTIAELKLAADLNYKAVVIDVPLLFEAGWTDMVKEIWVVYLSEGEQIKRLIRRDGITLEQAEARVNNQMRLAEKAALANIIIDNNGTLAETRQQVVAAWSKLAQLS